MRNMMWIYMTVLLFSKAWSREPGTNQSTSANHDAAYKSYVPRNESVKLGNDVNLTCSYKTWDETIFVIWNISLKYKECKISFNIDGQLVDSCNDGKKLQNTSRAQSHLHIPNFSNKDVGIYKCESVYKGGLENWAINVTIIVPPIISSWIEHKDKKMVAVCRAERGNPAANISWSHTGSSLPSETEYFSDGFFTVESRLELINTTAAKNLSCVIRHPYWELEQISIPKVTKGHVLWLYISAVIIVISAGCLLFALKTIIFRFARRGKQSDAPPSKTPPTQDVEEVEPYASYVQRVNSIYNS